MSESPKICLVMIATNEEQKILKCLESVAPYICAAVIVDSGNIDRTRQVAANFFETQDIPFWPVTNRFESGGDQRSVALAHSDAVNKIGDHGWDYYLMLDADNVLEVDPDTNPFIELTEDCYSIRKVCGAIDYSYLCLFRSDLPWAYEGILHEYPILTDGRPFQAVELPACRVYEAVKDEGERHRAPEHYYDHALKLEHELFYKQDLPQHLVTRYWFYLAQSYKDSGATDRAIACYKKRSQMLGFDEEVYLSLLNVARLSSDTNEKFQYLINAWNYRPSRLEAAADLIALLGIRHFHNLAIVIATTSISLQPCTDVLFLETHLYGKDGDFIKEYQQLLPLKSFKPAAAVKIDQ